MTFMNPGSKFLLLLTFAIQPLFGATAAPALTRFTPEITFDSQNQRSGNYFVPPDPVVAVGHNHVVMIVNQVILWYDKAGVGRKEKPFRNVTILGETGFWAALEPGGSPKHFDPRVVYDQYSSRFVVLGLETDITTTPKKARILLA